MIKILKKIFKFLPYLDFLYHVLFENVSGDVSRETKDDDNLKDKK